MTKPLTSHAPATSSQLLDRMLATPDLEAQVQALPWPVLAKLVDRVGLEDAAPLVAYATTEQLAQIFDGDLWRNDRPGEDESFDADRFLLWLEVMLEVGDSFAAEKLAALPEDLVTLAFHRHILVLDVDVLAAQMDASPEALALEKALSSCLGEEWEHFFLISRRHDGWDDIFAAIVALDRVHHAVVMRVLERCCRMSAEHLDQSGGLYEVLSSAETLEDDVAGEREERRAAAGYVAPSAAAAFLGLARDASAASDRDPLTQAYFRRRTSPETEAVTGEITSSTSDEERATNNEELSSGRELLSLLHEVGIVESGDTPRLLTTSADEQAGAPRLLLVRALERLADVDPPRLFDCSEQIAYLANVLSAGCSFRGRRMHAVEAASAAMATCSLGLEMAAQPERGDDFVDSAVDVLRQHGADWLFRSAWARLAVEVTFPAAVAVERWLRTAAAASDAVEAEWLHRAARQLGTAAEARTPWKALAEIDLMLTQVEAPLVESWRALLDECPSLAGSLRRSVTPQEASDAQEPRFIATAAELSAVQRFIAAAP